MKIVLSLLGLVACGAVAAHAAALDSKVFKCEDKTALGLDAWGGARGKCLVQCAQKQLKDPTRICLTGTCSSGHCSTNSTVSCTTNADCAFDATTAACLAKAHDKVVATATKSCPTGLPDCGGYSPTCNAGLCSNNNSQSCAQDSDCPPSAPGTYADAQTLSQAGLVDPFTSHFMCALRAGTCSGGHCSNNSATSCAADTDCPANDLKDKCGPAIVANLAKLTSALGKCFSKCESKSLVKQDATFQCVTDQPTACSSNGDCATNGSCVSGHCDPVAPLDATTKGCISTVEQKALDGINKKCAAPPPCLGAFSATNALPVVTGALLPAYGDPTKTQYCTP